MRTLIEVDHDGTQRVFHRSGKQSWTHDRGAPKPQDPKCGCWVAPTPESGLESLTTPAKGISVDGEST